MSAGTSSPRSEEDPMAVAASDLKARRLEQRPRVAALMAEGWTVSQSWTRVLAQDGELTNAQIKEAAVEEARWEATQAPREAAYNAKFRELAERERARGAPMRQ